MYIGQNAIEIGEMRVKKYFGIRNCVGLFYFWCVCVCAVCVSVGVYVLRLKSALMIEKYMQLKALRVWRREENIGDLGNGLDKETCLN